MAIETFKLDNGMDIILEENHTSKVISFNALVKVGSAFEADEEAGLCHVIEHMLFKGTPARPTGTIARDIEAAGGDINAYTSLDQTVFYINMATQFADRGLEILADAIMNPLFDAQELAREAEVILEEIRREQDNPGRMVGEYLFQTAYHVHTYGRPIIGYPKTVKSFTRDHLVDFHRRWYTPHNIVFIVVGDFESKRMFSEIQRLFSGFSGNPTPKIDIKLEPSQTSPRLTIKDMNVQSTYLALGFHIPEITHDDVPAIDILSHILGGSDSSRLEQEVKEKKRLAHSISSSAYTPKFPGLLYVGAMMSDAHAEKTIEAIRIEIDRLMDEPVTAAELSRAKINLRSNEIYEKETVGGQASKIASFIATAGTHEFEKRYYQIMSDVGAEEIMKSAKRYLSPDNCSTVLVVPNGSAWLKSKSAIKSAISPKRRVPCGIPVHAAHTPKRMKLSSGATLIVRESHHLPIVAICASFIGGTRVETRKTNGISTLLTRAMLKGTETRSSVRIAKDIEKIAGHLEGFSGRNTAGLRCEFLSEHLHDGFSLFADVLCNPKFETSEVKKEKAIILKAIKDQEDNLSSLVFTKFLEMLFPKHPYGLRSLGTRESMSRLSSGDLKRFHSNTMKSGSMIISIVGDVNPKEAKALAEDLLQGLPRGKNSINAIRPDPVPDRPRESMTKKREKHQAHIVIGFQGTEYKNHDRYGMAVLNNILAGQGGRLFRILRDKMSLAYSVSSINQEGIEPGFLAVYIGTDPSKMDTAIAAMKHELSEICSKKVSRDELERSKQYLIGTYELELQRASSLANSYTFYEIYGLGIDEIERYAGEISSVTAEDVMAIARRYILLDAYTMAIIKPK